MNKYVALRFLLVACVEGKRLYRPLSLDYLLVTKKVEPPEANGYHLGIIMGDPEKLTIKTNDHYFIIEETFPDGTVEEVQRFELPRGTKQEEVTAFVNEDRVLTITAPGHEIPPPERVVPIIIVSKKATASSEESIVTTSEKIDMPGKEPRAKI